MERSTNNQIYARLRHASAVIKRLFTTLITNLKTSFPFLAPPYGPSHSLQLIKTNSEIRIANINLIITQRNHKTNKTPAQNLPEHRNVFLVTITKVRLVKGKTKLEKVANGEKRKKRTKLFIANKPTM